MFSRAAIAVAAGADLVVERTVDFVLLRAKNGGEVVGHDEGLIAGEGGILFVSLLSLLSFMALLIPCSIFRRRENKHGSFTRDLMRREMLLTKLPRCARNGRRLPNYWRENSLNSLNFTSGSFEMIFIFSAFDSFLPVMVCCDML